MTTKIKKIILEIPVDLPDAKLSNTKSSTSMVVVNDSKFNYLSSLLLQFDDISLRGVKDNGDELNVSGLKVESISPSKKRGCAVVRFRK